MPIDYHIDEAQGIIVTNLHGDLTREDFLEFFAASARDPRFSPSLSRLVNATGARSFPASHEVAPVARLMRERTNEGARFAIVADSPLAIGMANMFMGLAGLSDCFELFSDRTAAMNWLIQSP